MTTTPPTLPELRRAVETRDAKTLKAMYADDAVITIIDTDNPPSRPRKIAGSRDIGDYLDDVYSRDMTHSVDGGVVDGKQLAFVQNCIYGDGTRVIASSTAELGPQGIVRQTVVQAWDS